MRGSILVLVLLSLLIFGCAEGGRTADVSDRQPSYSGFMDLKAGMWSEMVSKSGDDKVTTRTEVLDYSPKLVRYQFITDDDGVESVSQVWANPSTGLPEKYVVKTDDGVECIDAVAISRQLVPEDGSSYPAKQGLSLGEYTTPGGNDVAVAKMKTQSGEVWVSSDVPFGIVKVVSDGKTLSSLYDFGLIGARSRISDEEIEGCTGYVSDSVENEVYIASEDEYAVVEDNVEEQASESELVATDADVQQEEPDYSTSVSTYDGSVGSIDCSDCDLMPPAAKSACLASCS